MAQTSKKFCSKCLKEVSSESFHCPGCGGPLTVLHSRDLVGEILDGRFEVLELLGKGGMGIVYRARHRYLEQEFAIKVLKAESADDPLAVARFLREAKSVSGLNSPHTVRVSDFGVSPDGLLYLVMELLKGESLGQRIQRLGSVSWRKAFTYAIHVCYSLQEAHARRLWHRDIKPDNIFIVQENDDEIAKVLDFGIAKWGEAQETATEAGIICGTPEYLSPEQARGKDVDGRSDIYSLGAVLYEGLCGRPPFEGESAVKILMCHIMDKPVHLRERGLPEDIPDHVPDLVMWALKKKAKRRPDGVEVFAAALKDALDTFSEDGSKTARSRDVRATPTGLQYQGMVAEEETEDEVISEDEETTGDFMVSEEQLASDLAAMTESTADAPYGDQSFPDKRTQAFEAPPDSRKRFPKALAGIAVVLALAAYGGWYFWSAAGDGKTSPHSETSNAVHSRMEVEADIVERGASGDIASGREVPAIPHDLTPLAHSDVQVEVPGGVEDNSARHADVSAQHEVAIAEATSPDIVAPTDAHPLATPQIDVDSLVSLDAVPADTTNTASQDLSTVPTDEQIEKERKERRRKRHEERKREEARRKAERLRLKQEKAKAEEKLRKEKEEKLRKEKEEEEKKNGDDDDDDYDRIPGGE